MWIKSEVRAHKPGATEENDQKVEMEPNVKLKQKSITERTVRRRPTINTRQKQIRRRQQIERTKFNSLNVNKRSEYVQKVSGVHVTENNATFFRSNQRNLSNKAENIEPQLHDNNKDHNRSNEDSLSSDGKISFTNTHNIDKDESDKLIDGNPRLTTGRKDTEIENTSNIEDVKSFKLSDAVRSSGSLGPAGKSVQPKGDQVTIAMKSAPLKRSSRETMLPSKRIPVFVPPLQPETNIPSHNGAPRLKTLSRINNEDFIKKNLTSSDIFNNNFSNQIPPARSLPLTENFQAEPRKNKPSNIRRTANLPLGSQTPRVVTHKSYATRQCVITPDGEVKWQTPVLDKCVMAASNKAESTAQEIATLTASTTSINSEEFTNTVKDLASLVDYAVRDEGIAKNLVTSISNLMSVDSSVLHEDGSRADGDKSTESTSDIRASIDKFTNSVELEEGEEITIA